MKYATVCLLLIFAGLAAAAPLAPVPASVETPSLAALAPLWISSSTLEPILKTGYCWYDEDGNVQCELDPAPPDCASDPNLCQ